MKGWMDGIQMDFPPKDPRNLSSVMKLGNEPGKLTATGGEGILFKVTEHIVFKSTLATEPAQASVLPVQLFAGLSFPLTTRWDPESRTCPSPPRSPSP